MRAPAPAAARRFASALFGVLALAVAACGGGDGESGGGDPAGRAGGDARPQPGGRVVYGLEAESTGGFCLPNAQLAISGALVAVSVYDPLVWPTADFRYEPYLAESITSNADATEWTIKVRDGVTFHNGEKLDAEAVKLNLDTYRGKSPTGVPAPLWTFVFADVADVAVLDALSVKVTTKRPWQAFPAALWGGIGRVGMVAPAQLADKDGCARNLIGTGPFRLREWTPNDHLTVVKNPDYWRDGLPYLDEIQFRPIPDGLQRVNALQAGQLDVTHASGGNEIERLEQLEEQGVAEVTVSSSAAEVSYTMLNVAEPPFDDIRARRAFAHAVNRGELNQLVNKGRFPLAAGPFAEDVVGHVADPGLPSYDPERAKQLVREYEADKGPLRFTISSTTDPTTVRNAQLQQEALRQVGVDADLEQVLQAQLINDALGGDFQAMLFRNHPGGDPDTQYIWWHSTSPVNFGRIRDPRVDSLLDAGRVTTDEAARAGIYEDLTRRFAEQVYNLWGWHAAWGIGTRADVRGIAGPELPGGDEPIPVLAGLHPTAGLWRGR